MSAAEHLETERKYNAGQDFALPDFAGLPGVTQVSPPRRQRLTAIYFDTGDLRLAGARITLRRRTGGQDAGWHVKLPVAGDTRREIRLPAGRAAQPVPAELAELVSPWTGGAALAPIARLQTTRLVRDLTGDAGQVLAEIADDRVTASRAAGGSWQEPVTWREIEIELAGGDPGLLAAAGLRLTDAGAIPARSASKLQRLLGSAGPGREVSLAAAIPS